MYVNIESRYMVNECKEANQAAGMALYTKNQFLREVRRQLDKDEAKTLKYQLFEISKLFEDNLNRLNCEWRDFSGPRLSKIKKNYTKNEVQPKLEDSSERDASEKMEEVKVDPLAGSEAIKEDAEEDKQGESLQEPEVVVVQKDNSDQNNEE